MINLASKITPPPSDQDQLGTFSWKRWFTLLYQFLNNDWKYINLDSDSVVSSTTLTPVTEMEFTVLANASYLIELIGTYQTANTGCGIGLALDIPSGTITGFNLVDGPIDWAEIMKQTTSNTVTASSGADSINTDYPIYCKWLVNIGNTSGTIQLTHKSEVGFVNTTLIANKTIMGYKKL